MTFYIFLSGGVDLYQFRFLCHLASCNASRQILSLCLYVYMRFQHLKCVYSLLRHWCVYVKYSSPQNTPCRPTGGVEVWLYSFFKLGCRWGGWLTPHPAALSPGRGTRYPLYRRLGGIQDRSGRVRKISPLPGFDSRIIEPVRSHYTDHTILAHNFYVFLWHNGPQWTRAPSLPRLHDHTQTHRTHQDSYGRVIRPTQKPLSDNTQHSQETIIHGPGGMRNRNPSK